MSRHDVILLISVFVTSTVLHWHLQHKIVQCRQPRNQAFYSGLFTAGWPYAAAYALMKYGLPRLLIGFGFGPLGILPHSIAAWIQSVYGISTIFSFFQSSGARGGVPKTLLNRIGLELGLTFHAIKDRLWDPNDYVAKCVHNYESWLNLLNMFDITFVVCYACFWFFIRRR